ncbi:MAG: hypothetical protein KF689_00100 [Gemmatimonadaceae bacterium]|nr:hypothetical protein [Gemmatimonadaceae bacterium]MCW5827609.1 hypothetical protein [Gemmatimonadaceae bacterium]
MRFTILLLALALGNAALGAQQRGSVVTIAVAMTDTTRQFQGLFASEIRRLGDVQVVALSENPTLVLSGVVICNPDCDRASTYSVALRLASPLSRTFARSIAEDVKTLFPSGSGPSVDSLAQVIYDYTGTYVRNNGTWVANWGRNTYERAVREMVRELDTDCFEKYRVLSRLSNISAKDTQRRQQVVREILAREWGC